DTSSSPVLDAEGNLYLMANRVHISITPDGKLRWRHPTEFKLDMTPVVTTAGTVYFSNPWRRLCAFDSSRGTFLWGGPIQSSLYSSPVLDEQGIIHLCDGLYLYA